MTIREICRVDYSKAVEKKEFLCGMDEYEGQHEIIISRRTELALCENETGY